MVIYLDRVLLLNGALDYLLLAACGSVTAAPLRRTRLLLAALLGGVYAMASLLPGLELLGRQPMPLLFAAALCLVAFGPGRGLLRQSAVLILLAAAFSGVVLALTEVFSAPAALVGRRVYYPVSLGALVLTAGGAWGIFRWGLGRLSRQGGGIAQVTIVLAGRRAALTAMRDTGNTLRDPISGQAVLVADGRLLERLLPELHAGPEELRRPAALVERTERLYPALRPRLLPYQAVGVDRGMLLCLRPEEVQIEGKREAMLVAFSPSPVSGGDGYEALLGGVL